MDQGLGKNHKRWNVSAQVQLKPGYTYTCVEMHAIDSQGRHYTATALVDEDGLMQLVETDVVSDIEAVEGS